MDSISYDYSKQRRDFGVHPQFGDQDLPPTHVEQGDAGVGDEREAQWTPQITSVADLDCIPKMAVHDANTEQFVQKSIGTLHVDGAWPAEVKTNEFVDKQRLLRRIKNEPIFHSAVPELCNAVHGAIQQNNTIDLFENYFEEMPESFSAEPPSSHTICVFRDPNDIKRAATKISWHPDVSSKMVVSYASLEFQQMAENMPMSSYIWDVNNPNQPENELVPTSPLTCVTFNPRSPDHVVGGSYNGTIAFWDLRKGSLPVETSLLEKSHHDPVYDIKWIQSRTGNECVSVSSDGQLLWWDTRKLTDGTPWVPNDSMLLKAKSDDTYGGASLEYKADGGATRYLVGTEQGSLMLIDRKAKKDAESTKVVKSTYGAKGSRHHGPVVACQRNPYNPKFFLSIGDWSAKVWMEDLANPIINSSYNTASLTGGCWSPSRPGVFFTIKSDGTMDVWDLFYKHNAPCYTTKVCEQPLCSISVQQDGSLIALGSKDGSVSVLRISKGLSKQQPGEKAAIAAMFERETRREKNLDMRLIQRKAREKEKARQLKDQKPPFDPTQEVTDEETLNLIAEAEEEFRKKMEKFTSKASDQAEEAKQPDPSE